MPETKTCPKCGADLPANAPAGICPKCLMLAGLACDQDAGSSPEMNPTTLTSCFVPPEPEELAKHFPQLEILELLGKGGMGAVYKARQPGLDRLVAVKILPPEVGADPAFAERFTREARALAKLSHQNIVSVFDFGQMDGQYYFIMEFVDGANLRHLIETRAINPEEALAIVPQICEALQFAHDEDIVHRDIKPENILVDKQGRVKIVDFGLAKLLGKAPADFTLTGTHQAMGTLHYMAPEQMRGASSVDHRADIFSLGVVFYEMLTGQLPMGRFEPPSKKVQVDVRLDEVVLRSLESEPDRRYQHASDVRTDIEAISQSSMTPTALATDADDDPQVQEAFSSRRSVEVASFMLLLTGILYWLTIPAGYLMFRADVPDAAWWNLFIAPAIAGAITIFGGLKMKRCEAYAACLLAAVVALLTPLVDLTLINLLINRIAVGPGDLLGLVAGMWALVILTRPDVRATFRRKRQLVEDAHAAETGSHMTSQESSGRPS